MKQSGVFFQRDRGAWNTIIGTAGHRQASVSERVLERHAVAPLCDQQAQGPVRWLRPEFQDPVQRAARLAQADAQTDPHANAHAAAAAQPVQAEIDTGSDLDDDDDGKAEGIADTRQPAPLAPAPAAARHPWPADLPAQMRSVADTLAATPGALTESALADRFTGRGPWKKRLPQILQTLEALGRARVEPQAGGMAWRSA